MSETTRGKVRVGDLDIAWDKRGSGPPLLLVPGLGMSRLMWSTSLCDRLVAQGLTVVRMDNRDSGESSRVKERPPALRSAFFRAALGLRLDVPYTLGDMAGDAVALMEALGFPRFHVAGASMGGMIAQMLAIDFSQRILSLTSIMSTPGGRLYSFADPRALAAIMKPAPIDPVKGLAHMLGVMQILNGGLLPFEEDAVRDMLIAHAENRPLPTAVMRQFCAILAGGSRAKKLRAVRVPTLVMHGSRDPLLPIRAGRAMAKMVPGARFVELRDMGHLFHTRLDDEIASAMAEQVHRADNRVARSPS